jgi:hypothetical protein
MQVMMQQAILGFARFLLLQIGISSLLPDGLICCKLTPLKLGMPALHF